MSDLNDMTVLAGEYVLGLLDEAETEAVRRRAAEDALLAEAIRRWEVALAPLADGAGEAAPSALLWRRIERDLPGPAVGAPLERVAAAPLVARRANRFWPVAGLAAAAAVAAALWLGWPAKEEAPVPAVALLAAPGSPVAALRARVMPDGSVTVVPLMHLDVPAGHMLGFWAWPRGHAEPVLLGQLPPQGGRLRYPFAPVDATPVMVTSEPAGGPGKAPGPTLYLGLLVVMS